ncbi:MAG: 2-phospho-L-lactate transferase [Myxococcales bacterium]|nr:2-phospho-L-lactate transferase [Myxococcales bacterium]
MSGPALPGRVVALSGGVGGARFLDGVARALPPGALTAVVNTGDDFVHLGLHIAPDLDTVMYTLAGLADETRGWGLREETFATLAMVGLYGGPDWFLLGDRDLATHLVRTEALRGGATLSEVTARLSGALGIQTRLLPMADGPCRTMIDTLSDGTLAFQEWFVGRRAQPAVRAVHFEGLPPPAPGLIDAIDACDLVLIGPSNPYVSIDPILALGGVRAAIARKRVIAVSPIVAGRAVKGPLATMIHELTGQPPSAGAIARHYRGLLAALVVEHGDQGSLDGLPSLATATIMHTRDDRLRLAREVLAFAGALITKEPA